MYEQNKSFQPNSISENQISLTLWNEISSLNFEQMLFSTSLPDESHIGPFGVIDRIV